jgi:hypothetical protein
MSIKERIESLKLFESNLCICTPCVEIVLFSSGTLKEIAPDLSRLIHSFLEIFGSGIRLYNIASDSTMRPASDQAFRQLVDTRAMLDSKEETYGMEAHSGSNENEAIPPAFDFFYDGSEPKIPHMYFRGVVETSLAIDLVDELFNDIQRLVNGFPFLHGYAGYSFYWRTLNPLIHEHVTSALGPILKRYPGFGYGNPMEFSEIALDGIIAVSWLTMLGEIAIKKLGGAAELKKALPAKVQVAEIDSRIILRLGDKPEIGDRNRKESLPIYGKVGRILSAAKAPSDEVWVDGLDPEEEMEAWFDRFWGETLE